MRRFHIEHDLIAIVDRAHDHLAAVGSQSGRQRLVELLGTEPEAFILTARVRPLVVNGAAATLNTMRTRRVGRFVQFLDLHDTAAIGAGAAIIAGWCVWRLTRCGVGHGFGEGKEDGRNFKRESNNVAGVLRAKIRCRIVATQRDPGFKLSSGAGCGNNTTLCKK